MDTTQYSPFEWGHNAEQLETCFDLAKSTLRVMYPNNKVDSCDMYGLYIFDSENNLIAKYSTGVTNNGGFAMQNIDTKEVSLLFGSSMMTKKEFKPW